MCYTIMKDEDESLGDSSRMKAVSADGYMGIATSEFSFIILRLNGR